MDGQEKGLLDTLAEAIADVVAPLLGIRKDTQEYQDLVYKIRAILILTGIAIGLIVVYKIYKALKGK